MPTAARAARKTSGKTSPSGTTSRCDDASSDSASQSAKRRSALKSGWHPPKQVLLTQLCLLAKRAEAKTTERLIQKLARRIRGFTKATRRMGRLNAVIETILADGSFSPADRSLLLEAATWTVAWSTGLQLANGASAFKEAILARAASASGSLANGDTSEAAFVLTASRLLGPQASKACEYGLTEQHVWDACQKEIERLVTPSGCIVLDGSTAIVSRVARWTHVRAMAAPTAPAVRRPKTVFAAKADRRWKKATAAVLRLLAPGGNAVSVTETAPVPAGWCEEILDAADRHGTKLARRTSALLRKPSRRRNHKKTLDLSLDDRTACMAIFRSSWQGRPVRILLDYRQEHPYLEVAAGSRMLIAGTWQWQLSLNGTPLVAEGPWQVTHYEEDDQAILIVITAAISGGLRLERHLLMAHADRVVLLADAVVDPTSNATGGELSYRGCLPIPEGIDRFFPEETRELTLGDPKPRAMVLPLAMCEWNTSRDTGAFHWNHDGQHVELEHHSPVRRLFAPLWIDLQPRRFLKQITWRQLTVADTRIILRPEQAAGFRIQSGQQQWLLYRALDEPRNRTVLGCNVSSFFRVGTIGDDGLVSQMAEW
jgi:hypothetical protein